MTMRPYVVAQGDYLTRLAFVHGFDADSVWNDESNSSLREARTNPELLAPGDVLFIPEQPAARLSLTAKQSNRYRARIPTVEIAIALRDENGALAGESFRVEGLPAAIEGTSDGDGVARFEVPVLVREVRLVLPAQRRTMAVLIGHLDPIAHVSGVRARLEHLGYAVSSAEPSSDDEWSALSDALAQFQNAQGLSATGAPDDDTLAALERCHGS